jgi:KUP system potassium uptake protein
MFPFSGYSQVAHLLCILYQHAKVSTKTNEEWTTYSRQTYKENLVVAKVKKWLEGRAYKNSYLHILVLICTCTTIGDRILAPAISCIHNHSLWVNLMQLQSKLYFYMLYAILSVASGIRVLNQNMSTYVFFLLCIVILFLFLNLVYYLHDLMRSITYFTYIDWCNIFHFLQMWL